MDSGLERVFILEDDVDFCDGFKQKLGLAMSYLPEDWDVLHLAGHSPLDCTKHYKGSIDWCLKTWGGYAYIVNRKVIPKLIELISHEKTQVDTYYTHIMRDLQWFKAKEMLVYHLPGHSDIEGKHRDIKELYK